MKSFLKILFVSAFVVCFSSKSAAQTDTAYIEKRVYVRRYLQRL